MAPYSDTTWSIAQPSYEAMLLSLQQIETGLESSSWQKVVASSTVNLQMTFEFSQEVNIEVTQYGYMFFIFL